MKLLKVVVLMLALVVIGPVAATYAATVTPEAVKGWFDLAFIPIMWAVGAAWTKWPALKNLPNAIIPWLNVAVYIFGRLMVPETAMAGPLDVFVKYGAPVFLAAKGAATSVLASILWDKLLGPGADALVPSAVPTNRWWEKKR